MKPNSFFWSGWREVLLFSLGKISENFAPKNHPKRVETTWSALEEFLHYSGISGVPAVSLSGMFDRKKNRPIKSSERKTTQKL